jgi:O-antigen ligase
MAREALDVPVNGSISVNRDLTSLALIRLFTAASVFWLALQLCRDASRARRFLSAIAAIGVVYAAYGLIAFAVAPGHTLWIENSFAAGFVTSTFFNKNSFATYGGMTLVVICGLLFRLYRHEVVAKGGSRRFQLAALIDATGRQGAFLLAGAFVILVAVLLTASRGGIICTALGLFTLCVLSFGGRRSGANDLRDTIIFGALATAIVLAIFGDAFVGRIERQGLYDDGRAAIYLNTLGSISDSPLSGYGYGTFVDVFPMFRDRSLSVLGVWDMAHNTYLEAFQGLGVLFGTALIVCLALLIWRCFKGALTRHENITMSCVAASVAALVCVHALIDFSLQIQAVTLTFCAILGAGVAQSESSRLVVND